ncbi:hypothetical protein Pa4123_89220 [Phytohabitans aurantiacus]|uniref:Uncharacterized protein n=1 Tax=Phytohabitans aurantiacus TaxID=3016789 RepID=A0ABQ5RA82_9ACTN|nr:hypothetical protein Pa4123_89220 [Phytohabitans aurantiacus]
MCRLARGVGWDHGWRGGCLPGPTARFRRALQMLLTDGYAAYPAVREDAGGFGALASTQARVWRLAAAVPNLLATWCRTVRQFGTFGSPHLSAVRERYSERLIVHCGQGHGCHYR